MSTHSAWERQAFISSTAIDRQSLLMATTLRLAVSYLAAEAPLGVSAMV
jgi:hypothetical protein